MPPRGWKSVSIRDPVYERLRKLYERRKEVEVSLGSMEMKVELSMGDFVTMLVQTGIEGYEAAESKIPRKYDVKVDAPIRPA